MIVMEWYQSRAIHTPTYYTPNSTVKYDDCLKILLHYRLELIMRYADLKLASHFI
jgi:hypothetical protein